MGQLVFYLFSNPAYINQECPYQIGWIDNSGVLTNVTNSVTIEILEPSSGVTILAPYSYASETGNILITGSDQNITFYAKVIYSTNPPQFFSFCFVQNAPTITVAAIYRNIVSYLPQNVYNLAKTGIAYKKFMAIAQTIYQMYNNSLLATIFNNIETPAFKDLNTIIAAILPSSGDPSWERQLTGTNQLYNQQSSDYASVLTLLYQLNTNNNTNPYFQAYNISRYIYYRLGIQKYVLIGEATINSTSAFILNLNSLGHCILNNGNDYPGVNNFTISVFVIDEGTALSSEFQNELNVFIRKFTRSSMLVNVYYTYTFADLGLININDTYWKDPRQNNVACIAFNPNELAQALGYAGGSNINAITDFTVTLNPGGTSTTLTNGDTYEVIITPIYSTPIFLSKPIVEYTEFFSSNYSILTTSLIDGVEYFIANDTGVVTMNIYLNTIVKTITYTVT
jgi:hypothetical protein